MSTAAIPRKTPTMRPDTRYIIVRDAIEKYGPPNGVTTKEAHELLQRHGVKGPDGMPFTYRQVDSAVRACYREYGLLSKTGTWGSFRFSSTRRQGLLDNDQVAQALDTIGSGFQLLAQALRKEGS